MCSKTIFVSKDILLKGYRSKIRELIAKKECKYPSMPSFLESSFKTEWSEQDQVSLDKLNHSFSLIRKAREGYFELSVNIKQQEVPEHVQ